MGSDMQIQDQINMWTGLFAALGTLLGTLGTLLVSYMKGKSGLDATIDARIHAILDRQDKELQSKIAELREKSALVKQLEHEGRSCEQRCSDLERELAELRHEIAILRSEVQEVSDAQPL